jgi:hypothetical protein
MKPKEYAKKYNLTKVGFPSFEVAAMVSDLSADYLATIEYLQGSNQLNYQRFTVVKEEMFQKFSGIKSHSNPNSPLWDDVWKQLNSQVIKEVEEKLFGDYLRKIKAQERARIRENAEFYRAIGGNPFNNTSYESFQKAWEELLYSQLKKMIQNPIPTESFSLLGIPPNSNVDEVSKQFKKLALQHHPDQGGDHQTFIRILDAKNRCLAFLKIGEQG